MLNCQQATRLIERRSDQPLSWGQLLALRVHLRLCFLCRRYNSQSRLINRLAAQPETDWVKTSLSAEFKARLHTRLEDRRSGSDNSDAANQAEV